MLIFSALYIFTAFSRKTLAQYPSQPIDLTVLESKIDPDVQISYKQNYLCETTAGVKSISGYVALPPNSMPDIGLNYTINTFFWYFEARNNPLTAPLTIYLSGGPGESSAFAALASESGPCYVNADGNSTTLNPWSFNNHANVLYIDQPVSSGFSYTTIVKATMELISQDVVPLDSYTQVPEGNTTFGLGLYSNPASWATTNTTVTSMRVLWQFTKNWLTSFPEYRSTSKRIGIWGNSAGGLWVPAAAAIFDQELKAVANDSALHGFQVDTAGITNGCIDQLVQMPFFPEQAYNNTYGVQFVPESVYEESRANFTKEGGCRDLINRCRNLGEEGDANWSGANETVNAACQEATTYCELNVAYAFDALANRSPFDMAVQTPNGLDPCPFYYPVSTFLNQEWTQQALGVPLNFTYDPRKILRAYTLDLPAYPNAGTGDSFRKGADDLGYVLQNSSIKVALVYGDRDYRCPWNGVEDLALNIDYPDHASFVKAGYEMIVTNATYDGGMVRQYDKFSFSRVFQSGHAVSAYQPETVYQIFMRATFDRDIATGKQSILGQKYSSTGPPTSWGYKEQLPEVPETCMVEGQFQNVSVWAPIYASMM